jgi:hypothetical protein
VAPSTSSTTENSIGVGHGESSSSSSSRVTSSSGSAVGEQNVAHEQAGAAASGGLGADRAPAATAAVAAPAGTVGKAEVAAAPGTSALGTVSTPCTSDAAAADDVDSGDGVLFSEAIEGGPGACRDWGMRSYDEETCLVEAQGDEGKSRQ